MTCVGQQDTMSQLREKAPEQPLSTTQILGKMVQSTRLVAPVISSAGGMHRIFTAAAHLVLHCMLRHLHVAMNHILTESG